MAQVGLLEDNARIAKLCATMLHYAGHQVTVYEHPRECLRALLPPMPPKPRDDVRFPSDTPGQCLLPIDVLVLDLHLPDMGGLEVLRLLHASPHTRCMPLVFCTAASHREITQAMRLAPYASFVEKPFTLEVLVGAITRALKTHV